MIRRFGWWVAQASFQANWYHLARNLDRSFGPAVVMTIRLFEARSIRPPLGKEISHYQWFLAGWCWSNTPAISMFNRKTQHLKSSCEIGWNELTGQWLPLTKLETSPSFTVAVGRDLLPSNETPISWFWGEFLDLSPPSPNKKTTPPVTWPPERPWDLPTPTGPTGG